MTQTRRLDFSDVRLYAVMPDGKDPRTLLATVDQLLAGGVDAVQLRCRQISDRELVTIGKELKKKCENAGALYLVDDRPEIALATDADGGVHLGQDDLSVSFARELLGHRRIIGVSTHSLVQAIEAQRQGADYVSCGPLWATPTKPDYPAVGISLIGLYRAALKVPFVAIGGINETNIDEAVKAGAHTVAIVRALFDAGDPAASARFFKEKMSPITLEVSR